MRSRSTNTSARAPVNPSRVPKSAAPLNTCCITRKMRPKLQPDSSPSMTVHATETEKSRFFANTEVEAEAEAGAGAGSRVGLEGACAGADDAPCGCAAARWTESLAARCRGSASAAAAPNPNVMRRVRS